jgi:hypothetical protein
LAADFELMLRFVEGHGIKLTYLPEYLVKMRLGGATSKNLQNIYRQNVETIRAFKENHLPGGNIMYLFWRYLPKVKQFFRKSEVGDFIKLFGVMPPISSYRLHNMMITNIKNVSPTFNYAPNPPYDRKRASEITIKWIVENNA